MLFAATETVEWLLSIAGVGAAAALFYLAALAGIRFARIRDDRRSGQQQRR